MPTLCDTYPSLVCRRTCPSAPTAELYPCHQSCYSTGKSRYATRLPQTGLASTRTDIASAQTICTTRTPCRSVVPGNDNALCLLPGSHKLLDQGRLPYPFL